MSNIKPAKIILTLLAISSSVILLLLQFSVAHPWAIAYVFYQESTSIQNQPKRYNDCELSPIEKKTITKPVPMEKIYVSVASMARQNGQEIQYVNICVSTNLQLCKQRIEEYPLRDDKLEFTIEVWQDGFEVDEKMPV